MNAPTPNAPLVLDAFRLEILSNALNAITEEIQLTLLRSAYNPKDGDPKTKKVGELTFNWCIHHMAWTVHKPSECKLGKKMAEEQMSSAKAHSAIVAASAAATINPNFAALLATLSNEDNK